MSDAIVKGGHMSHNTTTAVRDMSTHSTNTGAQPAKSDEASLKASFPASPLFKAGKKGYSADAVKEYLYKLLTNTVRGTQDQSDAAAYWGFPRKTASEKAPESSDLSYKGAPSIDGLKEVGDDKAGPYMPNLHVPPIDAPTSPVDKQNIQPQASNPPYVGNGLASPAKTQATIKSHLVKSQKGGNSPTPGGPGSDSGYAGGEDFHLPSQ